MAKQKKSSIAPKKDEFKEFQTSLKNDENLRLLYSAQSVKDMKVNISKDNSSNELIFTVNGKNGKTVTITQEQILEIQAKLKDESKKLREEIENKIGKNNLDKFRGGSQAKSEKVIIDGKEKLKVTKDNYINAKIKNNLEIYEQRQKELINLNTTLNKIAGSTFNAYDNNMAGSSGYLQSMENGMKGWCATGGIWYMNVASNQHIQQSFGNNGEMSISRTELSKIASKPFVGVDENGNKMVGEVGFANSLIEPFRENDKGVRSIGTLEENLNNLKVGDILIYEGGTHQTAGKAGHMFEVVGFDKNNKPLFASDGFQGNRANPYGSAIDNLKYNQKTHVFRGDSVVAEDYGIDLKTYTKLQMQHDPKISEKYIIDKLENLRSNPDSKDALKNVENMFAKAGMQIPETFKAQPDFRTNPTELVKDKSFDELNKMAKMEKWETFESETRKCAKDEILKRVSQMSEEELKSHLPSKNTKEMTVLQKVANEKYNEIQLEKAGGFKEASKQLSAEKELAKQEKEFAEQEKARVKKVAKELKTQIKDIKKGKSDGLDFASLNEQLKPKTFSDIVSKKSDSNQKFEFSNLFVKDSSNNYSNNESYNTRESSFLASYNNELKSLQGGDTMSSVNTMELASNDTAKNIVKHR